MPENLPSSEFWCHSELPLDQLFERFRSRFPVNEDLFVHDCENVWEWFEGRTADGTIGFNISRPHEDLDEIGNETRPVAQAPIRFSLLLTASGKTITEIGNHLAVALGVDVHFGEVKYLKGNDFEFQVLQSFHPPRQPGSRATPE